MPAKDELELPEKPLMNEEEMSLRPLFNDFYSYIHDASKDKDGNPTEVHGPNALMDTSFDRMRHERNVVGFLVGKLATRGTLDLVLHDAALREGKIIQAEDLPRMVVSSLVRVREHGEWDNSPKSRETRKKLLEKGLFEHTDYPLISEAIELGTMLKYDGHEAYAHDSIVATEKWLEQVEKKKIAIIRTHTGDPAA
jgi:hypothetical protein